MTYPSYDICMMVAVRGPITLYILARRPIVEPGPRAEVVACGWSR
jgi:hypothetical protein